MVQKKKPNLNPITKHQSVKNSTDVFSSLQKVLHASDNVYLGTSRFRARVLRVEPDDGLEPPLIRIKARVEERSCLPTPSGYAIHDEQSIHHADIEMEQTFIAVDINVPMPRANDLVWVTWGNNETSDQPLYLGPIDTPLTVYTEEEISSREQFNPKNSSLKDPRQKDHGPRTPKALLDSDEAKRKKFCEKWGDNGFKYPEPENVENSILCNGKEIFLGNDVRVVRFDRGGCKAPIRQAMGKRTPTMFVNHWDVALSARSCAEILNKRGLGVHFNIDNDGTIYQLFDTKDVGQHSGSTKVDYSSIGVEISNAYHLDWQDSYIKHMGKPRPIMEGVEIHGKELAPFLGFYEEQERALAALWAGVSIAHGIPLQYPPERSVSSSVRSGSYRGFVNHFNITTGKSDCACLDMSRIVSMARIKKSELGG